MKVGTLAADPKLANAIFRILQVIHSNRKFENVDSMLLRLYEPILFRCLKVANPIGEFQTETPNKPTFTFFFFFLNQKW